MKSGRPCWKAGTPRPSRNGLPRSLPRKMRIRYRQALGIAWLAAWSPAGWMPAAALRPPPSPWLCWGISSSGVGWPRPTRTGIGQQALGVLQARPERGFPGPGQPGIAAFCADLCRTPGDGYNLCAPSESSQLPLLPPASTCLRSPTTIRMTAGQMGWSRPAADPGICRSGGYIAGI